MDAEFIEIVKRLVVEQGREILLYAARCRALLADYTENEFKRERRLWAQVLEAGIAKEINDTPDLDICKKRIIRRLQGEFPFEKTLAAEVVDLLAFLLRGDVSSSEVVPMNEIPPPGITDIPGTREYDDYYVNVSMAKEKDRIYIPCGMGETDYGFYIRGLIETVRCTHSHANIYALVYNYIIRNSRMTDKDKPRYLKDIHTVFQIDYLKVFRLKTIILQLIKNNYISGQSVNIQYDGDPDELKYAIDIINNYAALFCRLIGIDACLPLELTRIGRPIYVAFYEKKGVSSM